MGNYSSLLKREREFSTRFAGHLVICSSENIEFVEKHESCKQDHIFHKFLVLHRYIILNNIKATEEGDHINIGIGAGMDSAIDHSTIDILEYDPYVIALQVYRSLRHLTFKLTHMDHELFKLVQPHEFMKKGFVDPLK